MHLKSFIRCGKCIRYAVWRQLSWVSILMKIYAKNFHSLSLYLPVSLGVSVSAIPNLMAKTKWKFNSTRNIMFETQWTPILTQQNPRRQHHSMAETALSNITINLLMSNISSIRVYHLHWDEWRINRIDLWMSMWEMTERKNAEQKMLVETIRRNAHTSSQFQSKTLEDKIIIFIKIHSMRCVLTAHCLSSVLTLQCHTHTHTQSKEMKHQINYFSFRCFNDNDSSLVLHRTRKHVYTETKKKVEKWFLCALVGKCECFAIKKKKINRLWTIKITKNISCDIHL